MKIWRGALTRPEGGLSLCRVSCLLHAFDFHSRALWFVSACLRRREFLSAFLPPEVAGWVGQSSEGEAREGCDSAFRLHVRVGNPVWCDVFCKASVMVSARVQFTTHFQNTSHHATLTLTH